MFKWKRMSIVIQRAVQAHAAKQFKVMSCFPCSVPRVVLCSEPFSPDWRWGPALNEKSELCRLTGQTLWVENGLFTGISQVFQAHQCSALPNVEFTISLTHIGEDDIVEEPFTVEKGGFYRIPTKPGLGVTLDQKALDKYRVV